MLDIPAIFWYSSNVLKGRFAITATVFFFPTPGSHFSADAESVLISTGTGKAVTDRIPQSTTTASIIVRLASRTGIPTRMGYDPIWRPNERSPETSIWTSRSTVPTGSVSYTHLRAHETDSYLVCRLLLEKKNQLIN